MVGELGDVGGRHQARAGDGAANTDEAFAADRLFREQREIVLLVARPTRLGWRQPDRQGVAAVAHGDAHLVAVAAQACAGAGMTTAGTRLVTINRGQHAVARQLPDRRRQTGLAVAQQGQRTAGFKAVRRFQRGAAEAPAGGCAGTGGGRLEQQHGFQFAAVLVEDGQHLRIIAFGRFRLRLHRTAGEGQGEQGNSDGRRTHVHGV